MIYITKLLNIKMMKHVKFQILEYWEMLPLN